MNIDKILYIFVSAVTPFPDSYAGIPDSIRRLDIEVEVADLRALTFEDYVATIKRFNPDLVFCFVRSLLEKIASYVAEYHPVPILNWFHEEPNCTFQQKSLIHSAMFDFWFTIDKNMVPFHKTNAHFMPLAFDEAVYFDRGLERSWDVSYIGQLGHKRSWCMLAPYMVTMADHRAWLAIEPPLWDEAIIALLIREPRCVEAWAIICLLEMIKRGRNWLRPKDELTKSHLICQSKIHVGLSRVRGAWESDLQKLLPEYPIDQAGLFYQPKGRTFEAVGAGAMLLNDYYPEIEEFFDLGKEAITFRFADFGEFAEKLGWYIIHNEEREKIAHAGWQRGQRDHTLTRRIEQILEIVRAG